MVDVRDRAREYFTALERGAIGEDLAAFYDPDVVQEEFPNRLVPSGARRDLGEILIAAERGQGVVIDHRYEILKILADGNSVAVEFNWSGTLAIPVGTMAKGFRMHGRFASFLEFRGDRILHQRSYDCFEPW